MGSTCGLRGTDVTQVLGTTTHLRSTAVHDALAARLGPLCGAPCSLVWTARDLRSSHSAGVMLVFPVRAPHRSQVLGRIFIGTKRCIYSGRIGGGPVWTLFSVAVGPGEGAFDNRV